MSGTNASGTVVSWTNSLEVLWKCNDRVILVDFHHPGQSSGVSFVISVQNLWRMKGESFFETVGSFQSTRLLDHPVNLIATKLQWRHVHLHATIIGTAFDCHCSVVSLQHRDCELSKGILKNWKFFHSNSNSISIIQMFKFKSGGDCRPLDHARMHAWMNVFLNNCGGAMNVVFRSCHSHDHEWSWPHSVFMPTCDFCIFVWHTWRGACAKKERFPGLCNSNVHPK